MERFEFGNKESSVFPKSFSLYTYLLCKYAVWNCINLKEANAFEKGKEEEEKCKEYHVLNNV